MSEKSKPLDLEIAYLAPDPAGGSVPVKKEMRVNGTWAVAIKTAKSLDSEGYVILGIIYRYPVKPKAETPAETGLESIPTPAVCGPDSRDWPMGTMGMA